MPFKLVFPETPFPGLRIPQMTHESVLLVLTIFKICSLQLTINKRKACMHPRLNIFKTKLTAVSFKHSSSSGSLAWLMMCMPSPRPLRDLGDLLYSSLSSHQSRAQNLPRSHRQRPGASTQPPDSKALAWTWELSPVKSLLWPQDHGFSLDWICSSMLPQPSTCGSSFSTLWQALSF